MNTKSFTKRTSKLLRFLLFGIFLILSSNLQAQEYKVTNDLGLWTEVKLSKSFLKDFSISTSQHLRLNQDFQKIDDWITEFGLEYKINKNFALGANGPYTKNYKYHEPTQNDYRYDFDLKYDGHLSPALKLHYRVRFQKEFYGNSVFNEYLDYQESTFRHRAKLSYGKSEKMRFYGSTELFRLTKKARTAHFSKIRFWLGSDYFIQPGTFDFSLGIEHQLNNANPFTYFLFRVKYELSF